METKSTGIGTKFLLGAAALIVIFAGLKSAQTLLAPFLLAVFFAMILMPPLQWLKQQGRQRMKQEFSDMVALAALSLLVFLFGLALIMILGASLTRFADRLPVYKAKTTAAITVIDDRVNEIMDRFGLNVEPTAEPDAASTENVAKNDVAAPNGTTAEKERFSLLGAVQFDAVFGYVHTGVREMLNIASVSFLVVLMIIFMLLEATRFPEKVREAFGGRDLSNEYFEKIAADTWKYTKIKTIVSLLTGLATTIGLWLLGVEYPLLWGLLMFFLNYIPNIGQFIASVPPILLALVDQGLGTGLAVTVWLIVVNSFFGLAVEPRYLGEGLGISSLIVLLSLIFWGWLLGPIGMFLSAPLTMVLKIVLQNDEKTRWVAVLMSNR